MNCVNPFYFAEMRLEQQAEANEHGFDTWEEYIQDLEDTKGDEECKAAIEDLEIW